MLPEFCGRFCRKNEDASEEDALEEDFSELVTLHRIENFFRDVDV